MDTNKLVQIVKLIIIGQRTIIGPLAIDLANRVGGLKVSADLSDVRVSGGSAQILGDLVMQYEKLFGQASVEACKESVREVGSVTSKDLPSILQ